MQKNLPGCQHKIPLMADSPTVKEFVSQAEKKNNKNTFVIFLFMLHLLDTKVNLQKNYDR